MRYDISHLVVVFLEDLHMLRGMIQQRIIKVIAKYFPGKERNF